MCGGPIDKVGIHVYIEPIKLYSRISLCASVVSTLQHFFPGCWSPFEVCTCIDR